MKEISLCMIVKNEEPVLKRCLDSIKDMVDEIIIVDTGSSDKTKEIALSYTDQVYDFEWVDDFAKARNFAFSKANKEFVMWLDADDILLAEDQKNFLLAKEKLNAQVDMVMMKYNVAFDANGLPTLSYYRERIMKNDGSHMWIGAIHEIISLTGNIIYIDNVAITHRKEVRNDPKRNLRIFEKLIAEGESLDPRQNFYYARELYYNQRYEEAIETFLNFLDGEGWVENKINACFDLANTYRAIEEPKKALYALFRSFEYDLPRAEIVCKIGKYFFEQGDYYKAIFWYKQALNCEPDVEKGGFVLLDTYRYIPFIQLCVCYDRMGNSIEANLFNEQAGIIKPDDQAYLYNRKYFEEKLK